jgi:hypothetical protein
MENNHLSGNESLKIIEQMIGRAKEEEKDNGFGWIVWGWMLFIASIVNYVMIAIDAPNKYIAWTFFGIASFLWLLYSVFLKRFFIKSQTKVTTYTNELVNRMAIAFFISLVIMVLGNMTSGLNISGLNFGYLLLLYGFWMYIHASAFRDKLLKAGAFINWAGALIIFNFYQDLGKNILLVHAGCVALGYLIPGYIARNKFGRKNQVPDKKLEL